MKKRVQKKTAKKHLREVILETFAESGESVLSLSKRCGVSQPQLSRFFSGGRDLRLSSVEKLCDALDLKLVHDPASDSSDD